MNGIKFAVSTVDTLFHLKKEEFLKPGQRTDVEPEDEETSDPMAGLCRHMLQQRRYASAPFNTERSKSLTWPSFYPVFPSPTDVSHEINLDVSRSKLLDLDGGVQDHTPHILVVPSRLKQFTKVWSHAV